MRNTRCRVLASCALLLLCSALAVAPARAGEAAQTGPASTGPAEASSAAHNPRQELRAQGSTTPGLLLELRTGKERVYLREPVSLTVTLLAGPEAPRNIEYPRLKSPGLLVGEFALPRQVSVTREGRDLTAYEFTTTVTPTRSGTLPLGPAELGCEMPAPASGPAAFFGGTESKRVTARSSAISLTVLPLPVRGRPAGFSGAVGRFSVTRSVRPVAVQAGEPVTVRTVIRGAGNLEAFSCDPVSAPGLTNYRPRRELAGATLACEQVVIPESPAVREIPAVTVHFFDPRSKRYRSSGSAAVALRVTPLPAPLAATPPTPAAPRPPTAPPAAGWAVGLSAGLLLAAVIGATSLVWRRRRTPLCSAPDPALLLRNRLVEAEAALAAGDADAVYTALFRVVQACLGARLNLPPASTTGLLGLGVPPDSAQGRASNILMRCDRVRYGKHRPACAEMSADLQLVRELCAASDNGSSLGRPENTRLAPNGPEPKSL